MSEKVKIKVNDKRTLGKDPVEDDQAVEEKTAQGPSDQEPEEQVQETPTEDPQRIIADQKDQILRLHAEFDNYRKRNERETAAFKRYANEGLIKALLPHLDNMERALEHCRSDNPEDALVTGVELTLKGLTDTLAQFGVARIQAQGEPFDPSLHEAVMKQEDGNLEDNTVLAETQAGYLLHDRLLRPAMVIVSARPQDTQAGE